MNHGQENFPGMRALIRPNRQSQQWNYRQMVWAEKKHSYLTELLLLFGPFLINSPHCFCHTLSPHLPALCVCACTGYGGEEEFKWRTKAEQKQEIYSVRSLVGLGGKLCVIPAVGRCICEDAIMQSVKTENLYAQMSKCFSQTFLNDYTK